MAKTALLYLFILLSTFLSVGNLRADNVQKTWCVAKPSVDNSALIANLNFACSEVDCKVLDLGGVCNIPDTIINHASVAMSLYYEAKGRNKWNCYFNNSGLITLTNPSYGSCFV